MSIPLELLSRPIAHRGFHDASSGRPENSLAAAKAAIAEGYGIELDIQPSLDGVPMVFHDDDLDRLTSAVGPTRNRNAAELEQLQILDSNERIPRLKAFLDLVGGRVPLLIEIKDQGGSPHIGTNVLVETTLAALADYHGDFAIMSFNPFAIAHGAALAPDLTWGITTGHGAGLWRDDPELDRKIIQAPIDPRHYGARFLSHGLHDGGATWLAPLRSGGVPILAWTVRSPADEAKARQFAANITFEGYSPTKPNATT